MKSTTIGNIISLALVAIAWVLFLNNMRIAAIVISAIAVATSFYNLGMWVGNHKRETLNKNMIHER